MVKGVFALAGLALVALTFWHADLPALKATVLSIGWGLPVVLGIYLSSFILDTLVWQMCLTSPPINGRWLYRMWKIRMVGETFNRLLPAASMGGEPVKAMLLKSHCGLGYGEGIASLIVAKTITMGALVLFLIAGFLLMLWSAALPASHRFVAAAGLLALGVGTGLMFAAQWFRMSSRAGTWFSGIRTARRLKGVLHHLHDLDERLVRFYASHRDRSLAAFALAALAWVVGVLEVYCALAFLGHPLSLMEAWIIEAMVQMVRTGTFFIPASIGAQEGTFLLVVSAFSGSPTPGLALAVVWRIRDLIWTVLGLLLSAHFVVQARRTAGDDKDKTGSRAA